MTEVRPKAIKLNASDNVAVVLRNLNVNEETGFPDIRCSDPIPSGHKIALCEIPAGAPVIKYGQVIGFSRFPIKPGDHAHTHNIEVHDFARDYFIGRDLVLTPLIPEESRAQFRGIVRADGRVATRNFIGVISTVCCSSSVSRFIADHFTKERLDRFPNVDGVVAIGHGGGCGTPPDGEGLVFLQRTLAGFARHPNFAGVLIVGLGCEVNQIDCLIDRMRSFAGPLFKTLVIQDAGGTRATVEAGIEIVEAMLSEADKVMRAKVSAENIVLGLECGGSDAYSGISANPVLGIAADLVIRHGGTAILSETPEIYGAEHLLTRRAASREVGEKLIERIRWWEEYAARNGAVINNNPTPGNKAGGLTTILEKSLGAVAKGGSTNLNGVFGYAEPVTEKGLVFMDTPGQDLVSITGMIAGGANVVCFTSGRGTVCGFKPVPTLKLASNSEMYRRLSEDMDVNCGALLDGETPLEELGAELFRLILETASGKKTKSEALGFGDNEFVPWQIGVVL